MKEHTKITISIKEAIRLVIDNLVEQGLVAKCYEGTTNQVEHDINLATQQIELTLINEDLHPEE